MYLDADKNFAKILFGLSNQKPEAVAIHLLKSGEQPRQLTYRELLLQACSYAQALSEANIQPGDVVILVFQHGEELIAAFFGAILHGSIPSIMPFLTEKLRAEQYRASLKALFEITAPTAVITYAEFLEEAHRAAQGSSVRLVLTKEMLSLAELNIPKTEQEIAQEYQGFSRQPTEIVLLQHSSGTTGLQKGVALSHRAVIHQINSYAHALNLASNDVIVSWLPLYHDMGLIAGFILPILCGIPLVLMSPFDWVRAPWKLLQAISDYQGTLCWLPNFAYNFCAQKIPERELEGINLSCLRAVINCSEPVHWQSHEKFYKRFKSAGLSSAALATSYAMAENVFAVTQSGTNVEVMCDLIDGHRLIQNQVAIPYCEMVPQRSLLDAPMPHNLASTSWVMVSCGHPIQGTRIRVIDSQGNDLPERHVGEIALLSNCMLSGYYRRKDLTVKAFLDGWYLTGDLGYMANGELFVTGRKKDLIIVGGKNIYPQDLERLASEVHGVHPGRVAAFGVYNDELGTEEVVLIAESDLLEGTSSKETPGKEIERIIAEIRRHVTQSSDIALRHVYLVERNWLVKTSSGKVARHANRDKYLREIAPHIHL